MPALQLTADDHLPRRIHAVHLKHRLGDVETHCRDRFHGWLASPRPPQRRSPQGHLGAGAGAVHSIKPGPTRRTPGAGQSLVTPVAPLFEDLPHTWRDLPADEMAA